MASDAPPPNPALDGESQYWTVVGISIALAVLSSVFTGLRIYTRALILRNFKADDWAICIAQLLALVASGQTILEAHYGLGTHVWTIAPDTLTAQLKVLYAVILTYNMGMNVVKVSFLLMYLRIFQGRTMRKITISLMVYVVLWAIVQSVTLGLSCTPLSFFTPSWADRCLDTFPVWLFSSIMSTVTDFAIFILPLPSIIKLHLNPKKKMVTVFMFCLGFFTCAISVIRIFTLKSALDAKDPTWFNTSAACWSLVELNCAILCSCLPTLRPLAAKIMPGWTQIDPRTTYQMYANPRSTTKGQGSSSADEAGDVEAGQSDSTEQLKATVACYAATPGGLAPPPPEKVAVRQMEDTNVTGMGKILVTKETQVMRDMRGSKGHM